MLGNKNSQCLDIMIQMWFFKEIKYPQRFLIAYPGSFTLEHGHPFTPKLPARGLGGAEDNEVVYRGPGQRQKETRHGKVAPEIVGPWAQNTCWLWNLILGGMDFHASLLLCLPREKGLSRSITSPHRCNDTRQRLHFKTEN